MCYNANIGAKSLRFPYPKEVIVWKKLIRSKKFRFLPSTIYWGRKKIGLVTISYPSGCKLNLTRPIEFDEMKGNRYEFTPQMTNLIKYGGQTGVKVYTFCGWLRRRTREFRILQDGIILKLHTTTYISGSRQHDDIMEIVQKLASVFGATPSTRYELFFD